MVDSDTDTTAPDSDGSDSTVPSFPDSDGSDSSSVSSLSGSEGPLNIPQLERSPAQREALWQAWWLRVHWAARFATNASQREDNDGERESNDSSSVQGLPDLEDVEYNLRLSARRWSPLHHAENIEIFSYRAAESAMNILNRER